MKAIRTLIIAVAGAAAIGATAQEAPRTAYFLDGYSYRHELNPAFGSDHNYISIPALGNIGIGAASNVGLNTFLYKTAPGSNYDRIAHRRRRKHPQGPLPLYEAWSDRSRYPLQLQKSALERRCHG